MQYVPPTRQSRGSRQGWIVLGVVLLGIGVGVVAEWRWIKKRWTAWREEVHRVPDFYELPPERQQKSLQDPQLWHLKYRLAIQSGELKVKQGSTLSPIGPLPATPMAFGRLFSVSDVDRTEIAPIKEWVQKNVPASQAPIFLKLEVLQQHLNLAHAIKTVRPRIYKVDTRSVVEQLSEHDSGLYGKFLRDFEDGKIPVAGAVTIAEESNLPSNYSILGEVASKDVSTIVQWVRENLSEEQPRITLNFLNAQRSYDISPEGATEVEFFRDLKKTLR